MAGWLTKLIFGNQDPLPSERQFSNAVTGSASTAARAGADYSAANAAFDPTKALATYGEGVATAFDQDLSKQLKGLRGADSAAGRFDSGYFTEDSGVLAENVAKNYTAQLEEGALSASGQRLSQIGQEQQYAEETAGQSYDLLSGELDREQANQNAQRQQRSQLWGDLFKLGGTVAAAGIG